MGKGSKDNNDVYYRKAKEQGWRARSAFKLIQIDSKFNLLQGVTKVVDLCAAPGSWSQVLSRTLYMEEKIEPQPPEPPNEIFGFSLPDDTLATANNKNVKIVAVDLQPMAPLPGVTQIQGDIMQYSTAEEIMNQFGGTKADLVVCDGAPDVTGLHAMDIYVHSQLLLGALHITCNVLKVGGNFVVKVFHNKNDDSLTTKLLILFKDVVIIKPPSSRESSIEAFAVCLNYCPPEGFHPQAITPFLDLSNKNFNSLTGINRMIIPLLVNLDVSAWNTVSTEVEELEYETELLNPPPHSFLAFKPKNATDIEEINKQYEHRLRMFKTGTRNILQETTDSSQSEDCNISHTPICTYKFSINEHEANDFMDINEKLFKLSTQINNEKSKFHKKKFNNEQDLIKLENEMKRCHMTGNF